MSVAEVTCAGGQTSPRLKARIAGFLYLLIFLSAPSGAATATPWKMVITLVCDIGVALILYDLLKPVSNRLSLMAAVFRLIFVAMMALNSLNYFGVVVLFHGAHSSNAFDFGYGISLIPFGIHCLLAGILIFRSTFLPRVLGILMMLAGIGYLVFLWPKLGSRLFFPWIVVPAVAGEGLLTLWLLVLGVNVKRWMQQARASGGDGNSATI